MNAYELAEELQGFGYLENDLHFCPFQPQVNMLRQQADRITMLEKETIALRKQLIVVCNELVEIKR